MGPDDQIPAAEILSEKEERRQVPDADAHFNARFEGEFNGRARYLQPGEILCSDAGKDMFVCTVGSGIVVTLYDVELQLGGMCYLLLAPEILQAFPYFDKIDLKVRNAALKPIEDCVQEMKHRGAGKNRLQMRLIGGARFPENATSDAGTKNYIFVREYINRKGLSIINEDLGGPFVRRVHFFPSTGRAVRIMLRRASDYAALQETERRLYGDA